MTTPQQLLVRDAARDNAAWCAVMCRVHGVESAFEEETWAAARRTPVYYPDAVTLRPGADPIALVARIDTVSPGASVKDSFADLDLTAAGFRVLFEAEWIHRAAGGSVAAPDLAWEVVSDPDALRDWALAWDDGGGNADLFGPGLLDVPETFVLAGRSADGRVVCGAVAGRSSRVVGVSNVFGPPDAAWPLVLHAVGQLFPALPVVGYEQGAGLAAALRYGFEAVGPLRVWVHERSA
ncbi:hypothetical protein AB0G20_17080 [Streptomyces sp. NPDC024017]|uniref:hypothetical protein n=1 Tax=Streptomyces sp. NPDC024017 TaxID=3154326 RepID=UPI003410BC35